MDTAAIGVGEILDETETSFEERSAVAKSALDRLPKSNAVVDERDDADAENALA